jgi:NAD(P)-dependent dehydrogenase (short-subunit alcohol dehydrogenase family)
MTRNALVTGASRGIGRAIALELAAARFAGLLHAISTQASTRRSSGSLQGGS